MVRDMSLRSLFNAAVRLLVAAFFLVLVGEATAAPLVGADQRAAFAAAGFHANHGEWVRCGDTTTPSRQSGRIRIVDLNRDGAPEAWITEGSTLCYGNAASAFVLVTKTQGHWAVLLDGVGIPETLQTRTMGWPDLRVGLPGFQPPPIYRFDGRKYVRAP